MQKSLYRYWDIGKFFHYKKGTQCLKNENFSPLPRNRKKNMKIFHSFITEWPCLLQDFKQIKSITKLEGFLLSPKSGGLSSRDILQTRGRGVLQMWTSVLFGAKNIGFFRNLWCVHTDKRGRGLSQCRHFADKGKERANFSRFSEDILYGWPLTTNNVIHEWKYFRFLWFLRNGKEFSGEIFCIVFRKIFLVFFYNE